jgi:hypothetical protein
VIAVQTIEILSGLRVLFSPEHMIYAHGDGIMVYWLLESREGLPLKNVITSRMELVPSNARFDLLEMAIQSSSFHIFRSPIHLQLTWNISVAQT